MILVDVHPRDVFVEIEQHRVRDPEDFEWQKQARFYWSHDLDVATISIADVDFPYTNEYLGVKERLEITSHTDRCYVTLSQALGMCLGGAPAGPAGTGKTETTKDMGCTLGKFVMVTNCGDQMDYRALGGIYKGAAMGERPFSGTMILHPHTLALSALLSSPLLRASSAFSSPLLATPPCTLSFLLTTPPCALASRTLAAGLWSCFDEFNRIDLEVLSVAAQQVGSVLTALKTDQAMFQFTDGQIVNCEKSVGYFITMNPGYAGRQELPENLKSQHRGVTMMVPDREIIMKVKLTGCGYEQNALCAKKFNVPYRLCEEQLSKQAHYDFGLRNILAALCTCGSSKRDAGAGKDPGGSLEPMLVMRTLRDMNLSKFVAEDVPLFLALIDDRFPGIKAEKMKHEMVEPAVKKATLELGLQLHADWLNKVIQVYEMCLVRHSLMAVGPSGTGKSRIVEVLQKALGAIVVPPDMIVQPMLGQPQKFVTMNPKAILSGQMFGTLDVVANEWNDGIFAQLWRKANKDKKNFTWLVLDGPVDAIWIENMNTVMDDNRLLTLANNDRIPMLRPNVTLHFEVEDLRNASPATVSRAGIIYISEADLGWKPYIKSWVETRTKDGALIQGALEKIAEPLLNFLRIELKPKMSIAEISLMTSFTNLIDALLKEISDTLAPAEMERFVIYALLWSVGGVLETADRAKLDKFLRTVSSNLPEVEAPDTVFEYRIDETNGYSWENWGKIIPKWEFDSGGPAEIGTKFASLLIPTIDSVRCEYTLGLSVMQNRPAILVGGPATAKTSIILQVLAKADPATTSFKKMSFSQATTLSIFQRQCQFVCLESGHIFTDVNEQYHLQSSYILLIHEFMNAIFQRQHPATISIEHRNLCKFAHDAVKRHDVVPSVCTINESIGATLQPPAIASFDHGSIRTLRCELDDALQARLSPNFFFNRSTMRMMAGYSAGNDSPATESVTTCTQHRRTRAPVLPYSLLSHLTGSSPMPHVGTLRAPVRMLSADGKISDASTPLCVPMEPIRSPSPSLAARAGEFSCSLRLPAQPLLRLRGSGRPSHCTVFLFTGEGAHAAVTDVRPLKRSSPSWGAMSFAAPTLLGCELATFLGMHLGEHAAPDSPLVTTVLNMLNADRWRASGHAPNLALGHSIGDVAAAYAMRLLSLADALHTARVLGQVGAQCLGAMVHAHLSYLEVVEWSDERLRVAAINGTSTDSLVSITLVGPVVGVAAWSTSHHSAKWLPPPQPWHHPVHLDMPSVSDGSALASLPAGRCSIGADSGCFLSGNAPGNVLLDATYWRNWLTRPVDFRRTLEDAVAAFGGGACYLIETGAHPILIPVAHTTMASKGCAVAASAASMQRGQPEGFWEAQRLWLEGQLLAEVEHGTAAAVAGSVAAIASRLSLVLEPYIHVEALENPLDVPLMQCGLKSSDIPSLVHELNDAFQVRLSPTFVFDCGSMRTMAEYFERPSSQLPSNARKVNEHRLALASPRARLPGVPSVVELHRIHTAGGNAVRQVPTHRWFPSSTSPRAARHGAFVAAAQCFDGAFFVVSPAEAHAMDPQQRLLLEVGYASVHGKGERLLSLRAADMGAFLGIMNTDFATLQTSDSVYAATGATLSVAAGRLSFVLGTQVQTWIRMEPNEPL